VFEGGGFGVGLTVTEVAGGWSVEAAPPAGVPDCAVVRPSRLTEVLSVERWAAADVAAELERVQALKAQLAAYESGLVMALAGHRCEDLDGGPGRGVNACSPVPGTSEFFVDELAVVTNTSVRSAGVLAEFSWVLGERLRCVWAALADGVLDVARARVFVEVLGSAAVGVAEVVAPGVLPEASGLSLGRLRARLHRELLAVDAEAAELRRADAERVADVRLYPTGNGMSELAVELPSPVAGACWSTVDELAWMVKNGGDGRRIGQLRAAVLADLILRPWDTGRPPVTATLTVVAPLPSLAGAGAEPGEVDGQPISAAQVRELLTQLDAVCPVGLQAPTGGTLQVAVVDGDGALLATTSRPELARIARHGCAAHPDRVGRPEDRCDCTVLGPPAAVDRYRPSPAQYRFTRTRDRTCRQPHCGQPVGRVDLDHVTAYADGGRTACDNLCCLCRRHHRLKTHAPGWRFLLTDSGVLRVTTPSGITRTTRPPGLRRRIEQRALPAPPPPPAPPEEPPPF
jgi:hypothetical protein